MKKRVLSLFMALALCLTPLPTAAWSANSSDSISPLAGSSMGSNQGT